MFLFNDFLVVLVDINLVGHWWFQELYTYITNFCNKVEIFFKYPTLIHSFDNKKEVIKILIRVKGTNP